jgi:hypothetical protein
MASRKRDFNDLYMLSLNTSSNDEGVVCGTVHHEVGNNKLACQIAKVEAQGNV